VRKFLAFFRYELLMHARSWRLWLCLGALMATAVPWQTLLSAATERETLDQLANGFLETSLRGWILFLPVLIVITVDTVARIRATRVQPLVFTKPFSTLSYVAGCWLAVVVVAGLLAAAALATRYVVGRLFLGLLIPIMAYGWMLLLAAMPAAMALTALVVWVRTVFKHNISAYLVSALLAGWVYLATDSYHIPLLGWNQELLDPLTEQYVPGIGRDLDWAQYGEAALNTLLVSLLFLTFACYHLRRQEPQRKVLGDYGKRWSDMPTFLRFFSDLWMDRHVGASVHLAFVATLTLTGSVGLRAVTQNQTMSRQLQQWAGELRDELRKNGPTVPGLTIRRFEGEIVIPTHNSVACDLRMDVENTTTSAVERVVVSIPFGLQLERFEGARGEPLQWQRWGNVFVAPLPTPLAAGTTTTIRLAYSGRPLVLRIGDRRPDSDQHDVHLGRLDDLGLSFGSRYLRVTGWLLPRTMALAKGKDGVEAISMSFLFTGELRFAAFNNLEAASPDGAITPLGQENGMAQSLIRFTWPRSDFTIFAGPYEKIERQIGPLPVCIYCYRADRKTIEFALRELSETVERWGLLLGRPRGGTLTLVETTFAGRAEDRMSPGTLAHADLDRLARYRPLFNKRLAAGLSAVDLYQTKLSGTAAARILRESFHPEPAIGPLRDALYFYLTGVVQRSEVGPLARKSGRLFQARAQRYDRVLLDPVRRALFDTPLVTRMAGPTFEPLDAIHVWRMLHYLLDDDKFAAFLKTLISEYGERTITAAELRTLAERFYGAPLDWFFNHWLYGTGTPSYQITRALANMTENRRTRSIEYDVTVVVANRGVGRLPVPVVLQTERDRVTQTVWLDSKTSQTVKMHVPDRPEIVHIDPQAWITQEAVRDRDSASRGPAWRRVLVIE